MRPIGLFIAIPAAFLANTADGALLELEWAANSGSRFHTMAVGETATINIRLDLLAGESWGWAEVPLGVGHWLAPDATPQFQITGFAADGFIGPGFTYDRSGLPPLPFSPEDYYLITGWDQVTPIVGPATIYLDSLEILALAEGHDDIVFGETIPYGGPPSSTLRGADGIEWDYTSGFTQPLKPEEWTDGVGDPGMYPTSPHGLGQAHRPLVLDVVPEPVTLLLLGLGSPALRGHRRR
jgi:hypothetical protein